MRRFQLFREVDVSGVSGTGVVAEGVQFTNGKVVVSWLTQHTSLVVFDNIETAQAVHGHGGSTKILWMD